LEYRRNLPHFQPDGASLFITFRLHGTLPLASVRDGRAFVAADRELDRTPPAGSNIRKWPNASRKPFGVAKESGPCRTSSRLS
jgi:hypothetical protein